MLLTDPPRETSDCWCPLVCGMGETFVAGTGGAWLTRKPRLPYVGTSLPRPEPQFPHMDHDGGAGCLEAPQTQIEKPQNTQSGPAAIQ